ncbi:MAG: leucine-rich repeat domain-containing protein, partial [Holosporales bacterium]|nr:leucine-rich repeat domain-containing protein [Holosporales bacterium]
MLCNCAVCTQYCDTSYAASSTVVDGVFFPDRNLQWDKISILYIPSDAIEIGDEACRGLSIKRVACEAGDKLKKVGARAFADCKQLERVILPSTVTSIGEEAFAGCKKLVMIKLPPNLERIGAALRGSSITKIDISECKNWRAIWAEITAAKDLILGSRVRLFGGTEHRLERNGWQQQTQTEMDGVMNWFGACCATNMQSSIGVGRRLPIAPSVAVSTRHTPYQYVAPPMVKIENADDFCAFQEQLRNSDITEVHISGIREIPTRTFENCRFLNAVVLQDITQIGAWAFYGCEALKTITIPESVQFIDQGTFCNSNIQEIIFTSPSINGVTINDEAVNDVAGKMAIISQLFVDFNENNVDAPNGCRVRFPDKTAYICLNNEWFFNVGNDLFPVGPLLNSGVLQPAERQGLDTSVDMSVIGPHNAALFLERFTEDTSVAQQVQALRCSGIWEDIPAHTFEKSETLQRVDLTGVTTISERAFANCSNLSEITIPKTVGMLESGVFCGTPLKKIVFESDYINYVALTEKIAKDREAQDGVVDVEENKR